MNYPCVCGGVREVEGQSQFPLPSVYICVCVCVYVCRPILDLPLCNSYGRALVARTREHALARHVNYVRGARERVQSGDYDILRLEWLDTSSRGTADGRHARMHAPEQFLLYPLTSPRSYCYGRAVVRGSSFVFKVSERRLRGPGFGQSIPFSSGEPVDRK